MTSYVGSKYAVRFSCGTATRDLATKHTINDTTRPMASMFFICPAVQVPPRKKPVVFRILIVMQ